MEVFLSNKHLPRLFVQALNEKRVELFDEFIHPEYNNHNAHVEPGPAGVKAFFRHYLERRFTQEEATMRTFELRVYKLRTKEALDFYMEKIYPRHLNSFPPIHDPAAFPFMWVKGIRDIFSGLVVLSFLWRGDRRTTAILFAIAIFIPFGDGLVILSHLGFAPPIYIHWGTALYMMIVAAFLLRRKAA